MPNTFKNSTARNVGASPTTVYTTPASTQTTVIGTTISNVTTSNVLATFTLFDGVNTTNIVKDVLIRPGSSLVAIGGNQKIVLQAAHQLRVTSSVASSLDVIVSVLEIS